MTLRKITIGYSVEYVSKESHIERTPPVSKDRKKYATNNKTFMKE